MSTANDQLQPLLAAEAGPPPAVVLVEHAQGHHDEDDFIDPPPDLPQAPFAPLLPDQYPPAELDTFVPTTLNLSKAILGAGMMVGWACGGHLVVEMGCHALCAVKDRCRQTQTVCAATHKLQCIDA